MRLQIGLNDATLSSYSDDPLVRSVIISLFSWRIANDDDDVQDGDRHGWWGDTYADIDGDLTGSRIWELLRHKVTPETLSMAQDFCEEALQWLIEDEVARDVNVSVERGDMGAVHVDVEIFKPDGDSISIRFQNVWETFK